MAINKKIIKSKKNKAQSEIFGLMMVVVLISVGLIFIIGYMALSAKDTRQTLDPKVAIFLVNAITQTTTNCNGLKVWQLTNYCTLDDQVQPTCEYMDPDKIPQKQSKSACSFLKTDVLPQILDRTVGNWGEHYIFNISQVENTQSRGVIKQLFEKKSKDKLDNPTCLPSDDRTAASTPLYGDDATSIDVTLYICK